MATSNSYHWHGYPSNIGSYSSNKYILYDTVGGSKKEMDEPDNFVYVIRLRIKKQPVYYLKGTDPITKVSTWSRRRGNADEFSSKKIAQEFIDKNLKRYADEADVIPELMI